MLAASTCSYFTLATCTNDIASWLTATAVEWLPVVLWVASPPCGRSNGCQRSYQDKTLPLLHEKDGTLAPCVALPQSCMYQLLHCTDSQQQCQSLTGCNEVGKETTIAKWWELLQSIWWTQQVGALCLQAARCIPPSGSTSLWSNPAATYSHNLLHKKSIGIYCLASHSSIHSHVLDHMITTD